MDKERFKLGGGRSRPAYQPKNIKCPSCGAGLTIKDEHSELVVCDYCGSHLDVTQEEKKVLSKGPAQKWEFPLNIGDPFHLKGSRYEIIARMVFIEDGDYDEMSRDYLLYNPRHGSLWLSDYQGHYSLSQPSHVMPDSDPFARKRGDVLNTFDGKTWVTEETGEYELIYVDGALPWIASVGDRVQYAEFSEKSGSGQQYEVQRIKDEIEFGAGYAISLDMVRKATNKPELGAGKSVAPRTDAAKTRKQFMNLFLIIIAVMLINGILGVSMLMTGSSVLRQKFSAQELSAECYSEPFPVKKDGNIIEISATPQPALNNEWMALNFAIVREDDMVIHVAEQDIAYYQGKEDGESWSEGSRTQETFIKIPKAGTYRLLIKASSAKANATSSTKALHDCYIQVKEGVLVSKYFFIVFGFSIAALIITGIAYSMWKGADDDDDDDDD